MGDATREQTTSGGMRIAGLFAGIGGIELGLARAGHVTSVLCEIDDVACAVLAARFPRIPLLRDVRDIDRLPAGIDLVAAGFPCQDLSQAGCTRGIRGRQSSLIDYVFGILARNHVPWVLLENVPFMLQLNRGRAIEYVVASLEKLGYRWAYRVVDSRAFGLPQRRERVFLLACLDTDPANLLLADDSGPPMRPSHLNRACGFYWTEGLRGLGWAVDCVPTLKNGSTVGIPSPPGIWMSDGRIVTPDIRDAERLQGFRAGWTKPAERAARPSLRWKLVGNAVNVRAANWIGDLLGRRTGEASYIPLPLRRDGAWPKAAFGCDGTRFAVEVSSWPVRRAAPSLESFLRFEPKLLSAKATSGFVRRLEASSLRYPPEFLMALREHVRLMATYNPSAPRKAMT